MTPLIAAAAVSGSGDAWWTQIVDFSDYGELIGLLRNSILAGAVLALIGGLIAVFVVQRDMAFAVHGISELSFSGGAAGLLLGIGVVPGALLGSMLAALIIGLMGTRERERNSSIAVLMPFGLGLGILFLTLAAIYAYQVGAEAVITGVCETDFSGYPDCRDEFVKALNQAVSLGLDRAIRFETPLMWLDKAETWALADHYGHLDTVRQQTLTCYNGIAGDGCGACPACDLRGRGLQQYLADKAGVTARLYQKTGLGEKSGC